MEEQLDVQKWYNNYVPRQMKTGINVRHYHLMNELIASGLKSGKSVIEIGCGIGTLTGLIQKVVKNGKIVATDISNESIDVAKKRISSSSKIDFIVSDMKGFEYDYKFDFIVLADVIEHIPLEQHPDLFKAISKIIHEDSIVFINIPHPTSLDYIRDYKPELLQIIDQSISSDLLMKNTYENGLRLISYEAYKLFHNQTDYALAQFKMDTPFEMNSLSKWVIISKKYRAKFKFIFRFLR